MLKVSSVDGIQIDNVDVRPAIPEPANWATLLAGAGVIGAVLRRRGERTRQQ
uniref:PEPxxWA-CTERM sorting domain-containing protein n=1 Tax=Methyloversatilis thermotolerans TaxID=1346290 RepID=UPI002FC34976